MPTGEPLTPLEELYFSSIQEAANPSKQLELVDKRATWVFGAVGTVGTALAGFTLLAGSQSLINISPTLGAIIVALTLASLTLSASTFTIRRRQVNPNDLTDAEEYFHGMIGSRAGRATWAVVALTLAILIAGVSGTIAFLGRDTSSVSLEWQQGADGPTLSLAVALQDVDAGRTIVAELTATTGGIADGLYSASAQADESGSVSIEADVSAPEGSTDATLTVSDDSEESITLIEQASVDIPASVEVGESADTVDSIVASTAASLSEFWHDELAEIGLNDTATAPPRVVSFDSSIGQPPPLCSGAIDVDASINNAYYCGQSGFIAWDRNLMRQLYPDFGQYAVAAVLAHEWGHWVQSQLEPLSGQVAELHADCLAGAWGRFEESGGSDGLALDSADRAKALVALEWYEGLPEESNGPELSRNRRFVAFLEGANNGFPACLSYGS